MTVRRTKAVDERGQFFFGRSPEPFTDANLEDAQLGDYPQWLQMPTRFNRKVRRLRLKEWHFISADHPELFVALAIVQLGYISNFFLYAFVKESGDTFEVGERYLLGKGAKIARGSIADVSTWQGKDSQVRVENHLGYWQVHCEASKGQRRLTCNLRIERDEAMALLFPFSASRGAYTHKEVGNKVSGEVTLDGKSYHFTKDKCFASSDWTKGFVNRETRWNFLSFGCRSREGQRIGVNLSQHIYDDAGGRSLENALWIDGQCSDPGRASFAIPPAARRSQEVWEITGDAIKLRFQPRGAREENVSFGVVKSAFTQAFGSVTGTVSRAGTVFHIENGFGVAEEHFSLW